MAATAQVLPARPAALSDGCRHSRTLSCSKRWHCGIDMFDCVMPTRNGRHGLAFTRFGPIQHQERAPSRRRSASAPDAESPLPGVSREFSRAYLHHLFRQRTRRWGGTLLSQVNLFYYQDLMQAPARRSRPAATPVIWQRPKRNGRRRAMSRKKQPAGRITQPGGSLTFRARTSTQQAGAMTSAAG